MIDNKNKIFNTIIMGPVREGTRERQTLGKETGI
jgi:hypothetical protein